MMGFQKAMMAGAACLLIGTLTACGGGAGLSGPYGKTESGQWFTILDFKSGDQVVLTMIGSEDKINGTYKRSGDNVDVTAAGETRTLKIDSKGCLDGGAGNSFFSGVICKK
ncbi:hypothetical protein AvCA_31830 [Azotobacter vinelandii CA]|uniref:Lipoprotein n=2 Tax=Azotobacter vinelandii TaxID=354 RepID=C1DNZ3_AZOVD|nr:hypothetical protein [Azotobacter vinelandii]ACO79346.1 hypothetical protein Avin_31830 [Azotobacter vinelandii DJ]AGK16431.1 hypothetical protein AvCA_31830 [Azotobacter vinelandii CA]AGK21141.1 hypothetical protein AvCA6_31830 [Azotobacter vinelandii CA6]SFY10635.1 hypothetical protein SAMN04244547_04015 [Azotobacter vinelandii]GLK60437.1 hypothetical protein GCM10017624_25970 [Azotobacter vinelandii]